MTYFGLVGAPGSLQIYNWHIRRNHQRVLQLARPLQYTVPALLLRLALGTALWVDLSCWQDSLHKRPSAFAGLSLSVVRCIVLSHGDSSHQSWIFLPRPRYKQVCLWLLSSLWYDACPFQNCRSGFILHFAVLQRPSLRKTRIAL